MKDEIKMRGKIKVRDVILLTFGILLIPDLWVTNIVNATVRQEDGSQTNVTSAKTPGLKSNYASTTPNHNTPIYTTYSNELCNDSDAVLVIKKPTAQLAWNSSNCPLACQPCKFVISVGNDQGIVLMIRNLVIPQGDDGKSAGSSVELLCKRCSGDTPSSWTFAENAVLQRVVVYGSRVAVKVRDPSSRMTFGLNYTAHQLDEMLTVGWSASSVQDGSSQRSTTTSLRETRAAASATRATTTTTTTTSPLPTSMLKLDTSEEITFTFDDECNGTKTIWMLEAAKGRVMWDSTHCTVLCMPCKFIIQIRYDRGILLQAKDLVIPDDDAERSARSALEIFCPGCPKDTTQLWVVPTDSVMDPVVVRGNRLVVRLWDPASRMKFDLNYTAVEFSGCTGDKEKANCSYGCPEGWYSHGTLCFKFVSHSYISPTEAHNKCVRAHKGMVAAFPDKTSKEFAATMALKNGVQEIVVGLDRVETGIEEIRQLYHYQWWWRPFKAVVYDQILGTTTQNLSESCVVLRLAPHFEYRQVHCLESGYFGYACYQENPMMAADAAKPSQLVSTQVTELPSKFPTKPCSDGSFVHPFHACRGQKSSATTLSQNEFPVWSCGNGIKIHYSLICDGFDDCGDRSDEVRCSVLQRSQLNNYFFCKRKIEAIARESRCDGVIDCTDGSDEESCAFCRDNTQYYFGHSCLPQRFSLDTDNTDSTDTTPQSSTALVQLDMDGYGMVLHKLLTGQKCPETHVRCPHSYCIPVYMVNNGVVDCPFPHTDDEPEADQFSCSGYYRCYRHDICLHNDHLCDGVYQCPLKDDERYCNLTCPGNCTCEGHALSCKADFDQEKRVLVRYLDLSGSFQPKAEFNGKTGYLQFLNMSRCGLHNASVTNLKHLKILDLSKNEFVGLEVVYLRDMVDLTYLDLSHNPRLFQGLLPLKDFLEAANFRKLRFLYLINAGISNIAPNTFSSMNRLRTLDIRENKMRVMDRLAFDGLKRLKFLSTDDARLCCSFTDLYPVSNNECQAPVDELSSCSDLLRSSFFRASLWVLATLAVVGNAVVLVYRIFLQGQGGPSGHRVFVASLCVSDFLMGVYLVIIGAADAHYSGQYHWKREEWTGSRACQAAGVFGMVSSEVSAMTICLITIDRLIVLRFPLKFHLHMTARSAVLASAVAWFLGFVLAATPFLPFAADWEFYSQTGICLPLPITRREFPGQGYSFGVFIVLNFVLFCLIGVGQCIIYRAIRDTRKAARSHCSAQDMAIARKLFLIVASDFCCWFPVGVMGLLAAQGTRIPGVVNVWTAIFVLPLNSAINPFLYTLNALLERRRKREEDRRVKAMLDKLHALVGTWPLEKVNELYSHVNLVRNRLVMNNSRKRHDVLSNYHEIASLHSEYTEKTDQTDFTYDETDMVEMTDVPPVQEAKDSQVQIFCVPDSPQKGFEANPGV